MWRTLRRWTQRVLVRMLLTSWPLTMLWYRRHGIPLGGRPGDPVWYFAYGANMNDGVFRGRRRMRPAEACAGRVRGYRLRFNLEGRPRGKAAPANISADTEAEVWGVLYRITQRDMVYLNSTEGIPGKRYRPLHVDAEDRAGAPLPAVTYIADGLAEDGKPSLRYLTLLREGARAHSLPDHWIIYLENIESAC